jgi:hypothetical protein
MGDCRLQIIDLTPQTGGRKDHQIKSMNNEVPSNSTIIGVDACPAGWDWNLNGR